MNPQKRTRPPSSGPELKNRIYDLGFKLETMPSVSRPESQYGKQRPLVAKLNTKQKKGGEEVKSKQASILQHDRTQRIQTAKPKMASELPKIQNQKIDTKKYQEPKREAMRPQTSNVFSQADLEFARKKNFKDIMKTNDLFRKTENITKVGFDFEETGRTKFLVDKVSGKFDIDTRYTNVETQEPFKPSEYHVQVEVRKRKETDVDQYIELCRQNITNVDNFVYLARYNSNDPYDLKIVEYSKIKQDGIRDYYTLSKKGFCHFSSGKPTNFMPIDQWLKERDNYDDIKRLTFFTKFRKWKTLKMWRTNVTRHKTNVCKKLLVEKLFLLHPMLGQTLLSQRQFTCDMEKLRFVDLNSQAMGMNDCPTLENFKEIQEQKRKQVSQRITDYSKRSRDNIRQGINVCLETLKKNNYKAQLENDMKKEGQNVFKLKQSAYENLGFPDNMTYEQRSELRKECSRFLRFSYLIDFIGLESLRTIYKESVQELLVNFENLVQFNSPVIFKERNQKPTGTKQQDPMFYLQVEFNFDDIDDRHITLEEIPEFIPPPIGNMTYKDFNILYHVRVLPEKPEAEGEEEEEDLDVVDENTVYQRKIVKNLDQLWLKLKPSQDIFFHDLIMLISDGLNCLQSFERWSRHDEMTPYVSVLEEWDDLVGDDWEQPISNFLNPQDWLDQQPYDEYSGRIKKILDVAFSSTKDYLRSFNQYLTIYWENQQIDISMFQHPNLAQPTESFLQSLQLLSYQSEFLEQDIPCQADIGLLRVDNFNLKQKLIPSPNNIIDKLKSVIPSLLRSRVVEQKKWLSEQMIALKSNNSSIDEFVRQQKHLRYVEKNFQKMKDKLAIIGSQYIIVKSNKFEIKKEDDQIFQDALVNSNLLSQQMQSVTESSEKNLESIATKINKTLIPALNKTTFEVDTQVQDAKFLTLDTSQADAIKLLKSYDAQVKELEENSKKYNYWQQTLNIDQTRFDDLENLRLDLNLRLSIWVSLEEWQKLTLSWVDTPFAKIDAEFIKTKCEYYTRIINKCVKNMPPNPVLEKLKHLVFEFKDTIPVVVALRNPALTEDHWALLKKDIIGQDFDLEDEEFTLSSLMKLNVQSHQQRIQEVSTQATQESILNEQFALIETSWKSQNLVCEPYKVDQRKDEYVISEVEDLYAMIDEQLANLNNILGSRYLKNARKKVEKLLNDILFASETIDDWLICQKNWTYLENIFSSPDIKKRLSAESSQFEKVDTYFKAQMKKAFNKPNIYNLINMPTEKMQFKKHKETLNSIQKALENYLEEKRSAFPRFYFLSNDELLEILAKANDMQAINKHIKKCFDNINLLDLGSDPRSVMIEGMISAEGEKISFIKGISTKAEIEIWLNTVQDFMVDTLTRKMKMGKQDYEIKERRQWVLDHPGQIVSTIAQIYWASQTEAYLSNLTENENSMFDWQNVNYFQLEQLTAHVRSGLSSIQHKIIVALITQDVHARDIIDNLVMENIQNSQDFLWQQQLRYYWDETIDNISVKQVNATLRYGYEYMGATSRLVITTLTDRCWMTITGALNIKLGAAPAGPAGTGKTESTKDLAKSLGMLCVVFNCSDQIEYRMMGRLFTGLAQQGAWTCLDEFNRIDIEVLSVVAQQLLLIRQALLRDDKRFMFMDQEINLKEGVGVFITMNPGYAGRTELPDNLKVLFRPVSMMIPDYGLIAEIMLFSEGFESAKPLSKKMVQLYQLSSDQLSQQKHYDFGMRGIKSVLVMAGNIKRQNPEEKEDIILIKAMRDSNIPKFIKEDLPLFNALVQDLFPGVQIIETVNQDLQAQILDSLVDLKLKPVDSQMVKIFQLFETFQVRFGVMLVGFTNCGKTTVFEILKHAMTALRKKNHENQKFQEVQTYIMNPKSISMGELYGFVNQFTQEWQDGLASQIMRECAMNETPDLKWCVFDGPVDALWIENMNTVLDDNMMLCLANGQRIKLKHEMRMLFEVQDLAVASPATVSRCGMVYLTPEELGWEPYVSKWIENWFDAEAQVYIKALFFECLQEFLDKVRLEFTQPIQTSDLQLVNSLCNIIECLLKPSYGFHPENFTPDKVKKYHQYIFVFSLIWSVGANFYEKHQDAFDIFIRKVFIQQSIPHSDTVYGFYIDPKEVAFLPWMDKAPEFIYDKDVPYFNLMVPTIDTVRYSYITEILLDSQKMVYVTGPSGTGKSVMISSLLRQIKEPRAIDPVNIIFSAQTSSYITQITIESKLTKNKQTSYGAKPGRKVAIFIDDINMPSVEVYGAQPPIEMLRLLVDKGGVYDRKERFWKSIENTIILACSAPPSGGRNDLTQRFTRHFNILCVPQPNQRQLFKIFENIISGFLSTSFQDTIKRLSDGLTNATIEVYHRILKEKLPIPSKFHYTFNLRDVSKVFQGILMIKSGSVREPEQMVKLWIHESSRVFHDRLINEEDREWFYNLVMELIGRYFNSRLEKEDIFGAKGLRFGDILRLDLGKEYEEIRDVNKLVKVLDEKQDEYMEKCNFNRLIFFDEAIDHILRIARVLRQPRGSCMLIGVGGSGKQSLTKLASFILNCENKSIEIKKDYGNEQFRDFIKSLKWLTGVEGKEVTFLFIDTQIINESFLEDINSLLNSGEVPNIWEPEDKKKILEETRAYNQKLGRVDEPDVIYQSFVERVRNNLHIVLCMSPVGDQLRIRCRKFPSLVDCCTLDWFASWPKGALVSVAKQLLDDMMLGDDTLVTNLSDICTEIHMNSGEMAHQFDLQLKRKIYNTPKSYLDFIKLYQQNFQDKKGELQTKLDRLSNGLAKLSQANTQVAQLQIDLTELQPQLVESAELVKVALIKVDEDSKVAREKEIVVSAEADIVNKQAYEIQIIADEAQFDLDRVMPELEAALEAVKNIDKAGLVNLRVYLNPPKIVEVVMEGVCIFFGKKYEWKTAQGLLADLNKFITQDILGYDKENISETVIKKFKKFLELNKKDFDPQVVGERASAAKDLCVWCLAMNTYADVSKKVAPKQKQVKELEAKLKDAKDNLNKKLADLNEVKSKVANLKKASDEYILRKQELENQAELTKARLERAEKLTSLLVEEGKRWVETVASLKIQIENSIGDVFISSACISYCGPFTGSFRTEMTQKWLSLAQTLNVPLSEDFSTISVMGDPIVIRDWMMNGLPSDTVSADNSIYCMKGSRWPLMIDPQFQANKWIKNTEIKNDIKIMTLKDPKFQTNMKAALMQGIPVMIQDVQEHLDPMIDTILSKQIQEVSGRRLIRFAEADLDYDDNFRLYITTKIPNPHYLPEVFIKVSIINFTVTFDGLEDQLLADVVKNEQPEIEQQRDNNIVNLANYKKKITECEKLILQMLNDSKPETLLDDVDLISTLESSKMTSSEIKIKIEESTELEKMIDETRNQYRSVSIRGSILFFVIKDLSNVDPMYQYSLQYIKSLFNRAMVASDLNDILEKRLDNLINMITRIIYTNVCRGLFEAHKLIFSFLISTSINKQSQIIKEDIWNLFLRGAAVVEFPNPLDNPDPVLISEANWELCQYLSINVTSFEGIAEHIFRNYIHWSKYMISEDPYEEELPSPYNEILDHFDKLMLIKVLRPEKLMFGFSSYVQDYIGSFYLEVPQIKMREIYDDSDVKTPIIFVLSSGADPTQQVINFAKDQDFTNNLFTISLGQGQGKVASNLIENGRKLGQWILLQNCHLAKTFMPQLEIIIEDMAEKADQIHENFRLFLTSMPATYFPVSILQNGIKLTTEPPRGIKANLKRSLNNLSDEYLDNCKQKDIFHKLVLGTCFFHCLVQERRKFGPLGWNIRYEFNESDLDTSKTVIQMLLNEQETTPWDALNFVTGHINYGGRVTDDWDRRTLLCILKTFYIPKILGDTYHMSEVYKIPELGNLKSYMDYVEQLPIKDDPLVFGLHENANINYQTQESNRMMQTILSIQPKVTGGGSGKSSDEVVMEIAENMLAQIPEALNEEEGFSELFVKNEQGLIPSLSTVLLQEMARFNKLLAKMGSMCYNIIQAIQGLVVMSEELDSMYFSLINNQVPKSWEAVAYPSLKPLQSWTKDLIERVKFMRNWLSGGNPNCYWISGFYFPQGFLTGVLQTHARKYQIPIDQLSFQFRVMDQVPNQIVSKPADGVYIYGMYLEGATWNKKSKSLNDSKPGEMYIQMPVIYFIPNNNFKRKPEDYLCPLYKTSVRAGVLNTTGQSSNYILAVDLPSTEELPQFWVLRGVAMLTQLND